MIGTTTTTTMTTMTTASCIVYGIVEDGHPEAGRPGLELVRAAGLAAVVADADHRPARLRRAMEQHLEVLAELAASGPVLPLAFGYEAPERAVVADDLAHGEPRYRALLELVRGRQQYDVRVKYDEDDLLRSVLQSDGALRRRADRAVRAPLPERISLGEAVAAAVQRRQAHDRADLEEVLRPMAAAVEAHPPSARADVHLSLLIEPGAIDRVSAATERTVGSWGPAASVSVTGPSPAFSFMERG